MTIRSNSDAQPARVAVIITAAGSSTRMGGTKKEYLPLGKGTVLSQCITAFVIASKDKNFPFEISKLIITVPAGGAAPAQKAVEPALCPFTIEYVEGGSTRQKSVLNALEQIARAAPLPDFVLIHDGA